MSEEDGTAPPGGWEIPRQDQTQEQDRAPEQVAQLVEQLLTLVPDELLARLTEAVRQLLEALRALIDWCVERLERRPGERVEVRDIPIL